MNINGMENISLVIFDMDGLMFDTERLSLSAWIRAGMVFGYQIDTSVIMKGIGMNAKGSERIFKEHFGEAFPLERIRMLKSDYVSEEIELNGVPVKSGLYELLTYLEDHEFKKAVATSTSRAMAERLLESAGILDRFDVIVCGDEVSEGKPDPEIFRTAARKSWCKPEACIVLEDSANGILAASRAKMIPFLVPDLKKPSNEIQKLAYNTFESLNEVKAYLCDCL